MEEKKITIDLTPTWEFSLSILTQSVAGELENDVESRKSSAAEIVRAGKLLDMLIDQRKDLVAALEMMMNAYEAVLPGIGSIVVKDYTLINDAPCAARSALARVNNE